MDRQQVIDSILSGSPNRMREEYFIKYHNKIWEEITKFTRDVQDIPFKFKVWHWIHNKPDYVRCSCGTRVKTKIAWQDGFREFCSTKCAANSLKKIEKIKDTLIQKYGVEHYSKTNEFKNKVKKTSLEKWGVDNFSKTEEYKLKSKETYRQKWGVDNYTQTEEWRIKSKQTLLDKYGVDSWIKTDEAKLKMKDSMLQRYQSTHVFKNDEWRKDNFDLAKDPNYLRYHSDGISEFKCDRGLEHYFTISCDNYFGRKDNGNPLCTVCFPINKLKSIKEDSLFEWIESIYDSQIIRNYKQELELDIYLPEKKLGFEFNGVWWHSENYKDKFYHLRKTKHFEQLGIRLIHIWEDDWTCKQDIIKSQIKNYLGLNKKIPARKCIIKECNTKDTRLFLENNHIQGFVNSSVKLGLFYEDECVAMMTFDHYEGRKKLNDNEWNLNRFCNKLGYSVIGGASKLLKSFINRWKPSRIISYADRDWSIGTMYEKIGFSLVLSTEPDYKWVVSGKRKHKSGFRKSKWGYQVTESAWMKEKGINRVWDCGKLKFEIKF